MESTIKPIKAKTFINIFCNAFTLGTIVVLAIAVINSMVGRDPSIYAINNEFQVIDKIAVVYAFFITSGLLYGATIHLKPSKRSTLTTMFIAGFIIALLGDWFFANVMTLGILTYITGIETDSLVLPLMMLEFALVSMITGPILFITILDWLKATRISLAYKYLLIVISAAIGLILLLPVPLHILDFMDADYMQVTSNILINLAYAAVIAAFYALVLKKITVG